MLDIQQSEETLLGLNADEYQRKIYLNKHPEFCRLQFLTQSEEAGLSGGFSRIVNGETTHFCFC